MAALWRMRSKRISRIDTAGLAAVLLVVVMLFILARFILYPRSRSVDLAKAYSPISMIAADRDDAIIVAVQRDGTLFVGGDKVPINLLAGKIREKVIQGGQSKIYIKADARARYGDVKNALKAVQDAELQNVAFVVEQRKSAP